MAAPMGESASEPLVVYIDLRSPYSYVGKKPLRALACELGLPLQWRPYAIDIAAAYGPAEGRDVRALRKVKYIYRDARRLAARQGLALRGPQRIYDARLAHLGLLYARSRGVADAYIDAVYDGFFTRTVDIEDLSALAAILEAIGGEGAELAAYVQGPGAAELAACTVAAEAAGVFGVPTVVYAGEIYWGADRIPLIREALGVTPPDAGDRTTR